jgi:probable rRNA maturation factor
MPSAPIRGRPPGGGRLIVTVTAPDGAMAATRGLAAWLARAAPAAARGEVTVALVSDGRMRTLNRSFRNQDYATDVLSFPMMARREGSAPLARPGAHQREVTRTETPGSNPGMLGDIVIATGVATRQANKAGHAVATEVKVLALHGLLHLLGYDHDADAGEMARAEARLRKKAGLKEGLIQRGGGHSTPSKRTGR